MNVVVEHLSEERAVVSVTDAFGGRQWLVRIQAPRPAGAAPAVEEDASVTAEDYVPPSSCYECPECGTEVDVREAQAL